MIAFPFVVLTLIGASVLPSGETEPASPPASQEESVGVDLALLRDLRRVSARVEELAGVRFNRAPVASRAAEKELAAAIDARVAGMLPRSRLDARGRAWEDLGLGDPAMPSRLLRALAADVHAAVLDPEGNRILVSADLLAGDEATPDSSNESILLHTGVHPDETVLAHLLVHALQRERDGRTPRPETTDEILASWAWAEAEANLLTMRYLFLSLGIGDEIFEHANDPADVLDGRLVSNALESARGVERSLLSFVYQEGFAQAVARYRKGGRRGIRPAGGPPRTTREVLHPEVAAPPASPSGGQKPPASAWREADSDALGEQGVIALVSSLTGKDDLALVAADGLRGDALVRWEGSGASDGGFTVWRSTWATAEDVAEFTYAIGRGIEEGLAGTSAPAAGEWANVWRTGSRVYRIARSDREVTLRVSPSRLDRDLEPAASPGKGSQPPHDRPKSSPPKAKAGR